MIIRSTGWADWWLPALHSPYPAAAGSNVGFISGYFRSSPSAPAFTPPAGQGWWNNFTVERGAQPPPAQPVFSAAAPACWAVAAAAPLPLPLACMPTLPKLHLAAQRACDADPAPTSALAGVFYFLDEMSTPEAAASASDCAARCSTTEGCDAYNFCPMEATEG